VTPAPQPQNTEKVNPVLLQQQVVTSKPTIDTAQSNPPKVYYAIDLFNMLSMDDGNENGDQSSWCYCS
ncbi:hypothetical protein RYX36_014638, partial [Vicia faba]